MDGESLEKEISFTDGEELTKYIKAVSDKDFVHLFNVKELKNQTITECWIKGISITGKTEEGKLSVYVIDGYVQGSCIVNDNVLNDVNAQKLKEIEEIIKR